MNVVILSFFALLGVGLLEFTQGEKCPSKCICFKTTVRCMLVHIERVPQIPKDTTML
ncbi:hypothetical protein Phum_PHUM538490 [Pediculus humanus corporis]|uniref:Uncharacterized protein n=1 Tax=Pediculus humanus subsp. corporis TaxID=121224 RepID=E0VZU1_PEDHC|nr:uncharacterized protein Phum_PHUM538490 [Pediculus humanus corporis]EEB18897.1 hypothetical protein Phum_PHUM538490 [Pediculus humanus corporis]